LSEESVFIVEDELIVADDIRMTLENLGYTVAGIAQTGETAIAMIQKSAPDLILMDVQLKGSLDGIDTAAWVHTHGRIPVIFLSAYANTEYLERAKVTEPFGYIVKPFEERELHSAIEMALYKHRMEYAARENERIIRILANAIPDAILLLDGDQKIIALNESMAQRLGRNPFAIIGSEIRSPVPIGLPAEIPAYLGEIKRLGRTLQYEIQEGGQWFTVILSPIFEPVGTISQILIQFHEITDFKRIEQRIREKGITQIDQNMEQFQILNDQIRNPLQAISGYIELDCNAFKPRIREQILLIDSLITRLDHGWVESEKVRSFLYKHYRHGPPSAPDAGPESLREA
jgi:two-component system, response regulator PdtaR